VRVCSWQLKKSQININICTRDRSGVANLTFNKTRIKTVSIYVSLFSYYTLNRAISLCLVISHSILLCAKLRLARAKLSYLCPTLWSVQFAYNCTEKNLPNWWLIGQLVDILFQFWSQSDKINLKYIKWAVKYL